MQNIQRAFRNAGMKKSTFPLDTDIMFEHVIACKKVPFNTHSLATFIRTHTKSKAVQ